MSFADVRRFVNMLVERFQANRCSQVAGSLVFTTLLSLVPLVTLTIVVFGRLPVFAGLGEELRLFLVQNLLPDKAGRIIAAYALQFSQKATNLTLFGSIMLALGAFSLIVTIDREFNEIWGVRHPRRWTVRIPLYWATLTIGPLVAAGTIAASSFVLSASLGLVDEPAWVRGAALRSTPFLLLAAFFTFLYGAIPNRPVQRSHALTGGIVAALLLALVHKGLALFIRSFDNFTLIYGTFAALPIFLLWLYLSWVVILGGAVVASTLPAFLAHRQILPAFPGDQAYAAIKMLSLLIAAQEAGRQLSSEALHGGARISTADGEALLEGMREAGWIARSDEGLWLLAVPAERVTVAQVLGRFTLHCQLPPELKGDALRAPLSDVYALSLQAANRPIRDLLNPARTAAHIGEGSISN
jgi:membrane protein